ncbi:hypothetical protein FQN50_004582 [Emmonsiellopsis sp. PD_5]|nr:hypothetical protein FQN50_004582 [Emmonsiellopsis sp. PD_5]
MSTLLDYLSTVDPDLDRKNVKKGRNSFNEEWDEVEGIQEWTDFTYENMLAMLGEILTLPYQPDQLFMPPPLRRATRLIVDEPTVSAVLLKWNHTIVDRALELASEKFTEGMRSISWALGVHAGLPGRTFFPDWAGLELKANFPNSRVPGDSKVSGKWSSAQLHGKASERYEFFKPLRQVIHYARLFNTRYAYVVSDKELICIRRSVSENKGPPLEHGLPTTPARKSRKEPSTPSSPPHTLGSPFRVVVPRPEESAEQFLTPQRRPKPRQNSIASTMSAMSLDSPSVVVSSPSDIKSSPSNYTEDGNPDVNEAFVEIVTVPWGETRPGHLTINLALFWVHILAGFDVDLRQSYPPLGRGLGEAFGLCS